MIQTFECKKCHNRFDEIVKFQKTGKYPKVKCPECGSGKKEVLMGAPSFNFSNPVGTGKWTSDDTGHDYRYKYMQPSVRKQRENAMKKSHVGPTPYNDIDDVSSGKYFGEVK